MVEIKEGFEDILDYYIKLSKAELDDFLKDEKIIDYIDSGNIGKVYTKWEVKQGKYRTNSLTALLLKSGIDPLINFDGELHSNMFAKLPIKSISIPDIIYWIGEDIFDNCKYLETINIENMTQGEFFKTFNMLKNLTHIHTMLGTYENKTKILFKEN